MARQKGGGDYERGRKDNPAAELDGLPGQPGLPQSFARNMPYVNRCR
jgi:hypothetical protein